MEIKFQRLLGEAVLLWYNKFKDLLRSGKLTGNSGTTGIPLDFSEQKLTFWKFVNRML
jgi:hypothetical protein